MMKRGDRTVLEALSKGESVGASRFPEKLLEHLRDEHLIIATSHGSKVSYKAVNPCAIIVPPGGPEMTRAGQVEAFGDSKIYRTRSCPGFPVNSYEPVRSVLGGRSLIIDPCPGTFLFISDWQEFRIPEDVIVIGVENMENFRMVRRQKYLFEHLCAPILFVSRYPQSTDLVSWLESIPNRYIHFGDLDLAGINIFLTEFQCHLGSRASFFIPRDADERLSRGSRDRYDSQLARFESLSAPDPRLEFLISLIHKHHRGYDQEGFI